MPFSTKRLAFVTFVLAASFSLVACGSDPAPRPEVEDFCKVTESHAKSCRYKFDSDKCLEVAPTYDMAALLGGMACPAQGTCAEFADCVKQHVAWSSSFMDVPSARCGGAPTECRSMPIASCESQRGCKAYRSTVDKSLDTCMGYQTSCETFVDPTSCAGQSGCAWK